MTREIVADCSVTASWFIPGERSVHAGRLLENIMNGQILLTEPTLWHYETVNLLRTSVKRGRLSEQSAHKTLCLINEIPITFLDPGHEGDFQILRLSLEHDLTGYDATYLALAEIRGIELLTADTDLLRLSPRFPWIKSISSNDFSVI